MMSGINSRVLSSASRPFDGFGDPVAGELQIRRVHLARILVVLDHEHERIRVCPP